MKQKFIIPSVGKPVAVLNSRWSSNLSKSHKVTYLRVSGEIAIFRNQITFTMTIGDKIPEILGVDQDGNQIKASDYRGRKIVLYSYPKANTGGCTAEACSLQAHKQELESMGYSIIGISRDKQAAQKKFATAQGLEFPLVADTETTVLQQLGAWG